MLKMIPNAVDTDRFRRSTDPGPMSDVPLRGVRGPAAHGRGRVRAARRVGRRGARVPARLLITGRRPEDDAHAGAGWPNSASPTASSSWAARRRAGGACDAAVDAQPSFQGGHAQLGPRGHGLGLPVVATQISGNVDLVFDDDNSLLVPSGDAPAFARALVALLKDPERARRMGLRSRARVTERYGLDAVIGELIAIYDEGRVA